MSSSLNRIKKSLMSAMQSANKQGTSAYDTTAVVRRIEGDIAWVHIAGGVDETPVKLTIAAKAGDSVQVRVGGGRAWITGNATAPPTDDQKANEANDKAVEADVKAKRALKDASDAMDEAKSAQDEANQLAINMANAVVRINADIENLQDQIDGNITTWFYDYDPTNSNLPASEWIAEGTESAHIGDLFYNNTSGYSWRWQVTNGTYSWQRVTDTDVARALADAARAQDTADSKRRVFYTQPTPPYDKGDLWVQGSGGDILRCAQDKVEGQVYVSSDWVLASKYTDDSTLNNWLANTYAADKTSIQSQIDGKAETWYQTSDPATNWTAAEKQKHEGDLWYRTSDGTTWYYTGSTWNQQQVPTSVFNAIDGKANIFVGNSTPTDPKDGDLWMQSASSDILTYVGNRWVKYNKYTDDTLASEAKTMATATQEHFWTDSAGAHITRKTQQEYSANPTNGGANTLIDSNGMKIRNGQVNLAQFLANSAVIGKESSDHVTINANGLTLSNGQTDRIMLTQYNDMQAIQFLNRNVYIAGRADSDMDSVTIGAYGYNDNVNAEVNLIADGENGEAYLTVSDIDSINDIGVVIAPNGVINAGGTITVYKDSSAAARLRAYHSQGKSVDLIATQSGNVGVYSPDYDAYLIRFDADGDLRTSRALTFGSHNSPVGTQLTGNGSKRMSPSGSLAKLGDLVTLPAGSWLVMCSVRFPSSPGGTRGAQLYVDGSSISVAYGAGPCQTNAIVGFECVTSVSSSSSMDIDVYARQSSDETLTVDYYWRAMRIA